MKKIKKRYQVRNFEEKLLKCFFWKWRAIRYIWKTNCFCCSIYKIKEKQNCES